MKEKSQVLLLIIVIVSLLAFVFQLQQSHIVKTQLVNYYGKNIQTLEMEIDNMLNYINKEKYSKEGLIRYAGQCDVSIAMANNIYLPMGNYYSRLSNNLIDLSKVLEDDSKVKEKQKAVEEIKVNLNILKSTYNLINEELNRDCDFNDFIHKYKTFNSTDFRWKIANYLREKEYDVYNDQ